MLILLWIFYIRMFKSAEIVISKKSKMPHFFARTKDQLVVNAINNFVTVLIGAIFGVLVGPYIREFLQMLVK